MVGRRQSWSCGGTIWPHSHVRTAAQRLSTALGPVLRVPPHSHVAPPCKSFCGACRPAGPCGSFTQVAAPLRVLSTGVGRKQQHADEARRAAVLPGAKGEALLLGLACQCYNRLLHRDSATVYCDGVLHASAVTGFCVMIVQQDPATGCCHRVWHTASASSGFCNAVQKQGVVHERCNRALQQGAVRVGGGRNAARRGAAAHPCLKRQLGAVRVGCGRKTARRGAATHPCLKRHAAARNCSRSVRLFVVYASLPRGAALTSFGAGPWRGVLWRGTLVDNAAVIQRCQAGHT
eukprot:359306-Chlamydomonas_euryale.AAC.4